MERMKQWVILFMRSWASKWNAEKRLPENLQVAFLYSIRCLQAVYFKAAFNRGKLLVCGGRAEAGECVGGAQVVGGGE